MTFDKLLTEDYGVITPNTGQVSRKNQTPKQYWLIVIFCVPKWMCARYLGFYTGAILDNEMSPDRGALRYLRLYRIRPFPKPQWRKGVWYRTWKLIKYLPNHIQRSILNAMRTECYCALLSRYQRITIWRRSSQATMQDNPSFEPQIQ
jgi:hypothetical protein